MIKLITKKVASVTASFFIILFFAQFLAYPIGKLKAKNDLHHGYYEIKSAGLPAPWQQDYGNLLYNQHNIVLKPIGCSPDLYSDGYNSVTEPYLLNKFGVGVFDKCAEEAKLQWDTKQEKAKALGTSPELL